LQNMAIENARQKQADMNAALTNMQLKQQLAAFEMPQQSFERRSKEADSLGLQRGSREYQEYVGTGKMTSLSRSLNAKTFTDPNGKQFMGVVDPDGKIVNVDTQEVVPGALQTTTSANTPKPFNYVGQDGKPKRGFTVGMQAYDNEGKAFQVPPDVFQAWMQPRFSENFTMKEVQQPDGSTLLVPVETSSVTTRGAPPAPGQPIAQGPGTRVLGPGTTAGGKVPPQVAKAYDDYNQAVTRQTVMVNSLPEALAGNQQAQINIVANHLGMTAGIQKGSRINQSLWDEAMTSAPWLDVFLSRFSYVDQATGEHVFTGPLSGVHIPSEALKQMVQLSYDRVNAQKAQWEREIQAARTGYGMRPPKPIPGAPPPGADVVPLDQFLKGQ
jgi:hypothetical protein